MRVSGLPVRCHSYTGSCMAMPTRRTLRLSTRSWHHDALWAGSDDILASSLEFWAKCAMPGFARILFDIR
jgi:hypothetical protein